MTGRSDVKRQLHSFLVPAEGLRLAEVWLWEDCFLFLQGGLATATAALSPGQGLRATAAQP